MINLSNASQPQDSTIWDFDPVKGMLILITRSQFSPIRFNREMV